VTCVVIGGGLRTRPDVQAVNADRVNYGFRPSCKRSVQRRQNTAEDRSRYRHSVRSDFIYLGRICVCYFVAV